MKTIVYALGALCVAQTIYASEIDILTSTLADKGVITQGEAQHILGTAKDNTKKSSTQSGTQKVKFKGDFRFRYQTEDKGTYWRKRERIRMRVGADVAINEKALMAVGLASGYTDPRSTNQTFERTFEHKTIMLDYAYLQYAVRSDVSLIGGKFLTKNLWWNPTDFIWDTDISVEGIGASVQKKCWGLDMSLNAANLILEEAGANGLTSMGVAQLGILKQISATTRIKLAGTVYDTYPIKGKTLTNMGSGNTLVAGQYKYSYNSIVYNGEIAWNDVSLGMLSLPFAALFGEYATNPDPPTDNVGNIVGVTFGSEKISKWGDWKFTTCYRMLQKDAWFAAFPDSDASDGKTNVEGMEFILDYGITKNMYCALDYYSMRTMGTTDVARGLLQVDMNIKF